MIKIYFKYSAKQEKPAHFSNKTLRNQRLKLINRATIVDHLGHHLTLGAY